MPRLPYTAVFVCLGFIFAASACTTATVSPAASSEPIVRHAKRGGDTLEYRFHPVTKKLQEFRDGTTVIKFSYNEANELKHVAADDGRTLDFGYNRQGKIDTVIEEDRARGMRREMHFTYNDNNRPSRIELKGVGTLVVSYDEKGEISKVDSDGGTKMALEITQAFGNMQSLVGMASKTPDPVPCKQPADKHCSNRHGGGMP